MSQTFRETILIKLNAISRLTAIVGPRIWPGVLPQTYDLKANGPALTYTISGYPRGHVLTGSDGTATARVEFSAWAYLRSDADAITLAIWDSIDGVPANPWADGSIEIMSCIQEDESDEEIAPLSGTDQWQYPVISQYSIKHRTALPSLD